MDDPELTALADRLKLSNRAYFAITAGVLKSAGVDKDDIALSKDTIKRNRNKNREELATKLQLSLLRRLSMRSYEYIGTTKLCKTSQVKTPDTQDLESIALVNLRLKKVNS